MTDYLENKNLLSNSQHGFRPRLSTETTLTVVTDKMYSHFVTFLRHLTVSAITFLWVNVLNSKLIFWLSSYLKNRTQTVCINNYVSKKQCISFGVPQGSLFNIFVDEMIEKINNCLVIQYADYTQFLHSSYVISDTVATLKRIKRYFLTNGLMLTSSKTLCIFKENRQLLAHIPLNTVTKTDEDTITPSNFVKNLGLYMDRYKFFDKHTDIMSKKVTGVLMFF